MITGITVPAKQLQRTVIPQHVVARPLNSLAASANAAAKFSDIELAFDFVSSGAPSEHSAFLCLETGVCHWHTELGDNAEPLPDDIMDAGKYIEIPHKNDLGLGKPLALNFARRALPDDFEEVAGIFQHRGAYGRFKSLLERRGTGRVVRV